MAKRIHVCAIEELPPGTRCVVTLEDYQEVLVLNVDGVLHAVSNFCPHEGAALQRGPVEEGILYCPLHRWGFTLATLQCISDASVCGLTYPVDVEDGQVVLHLPANHSSAQESA